MASCATGRCALKEDRRRLSAILCATIQPTSSAASQPADRRQSTRLPPTRDHDTRVKRQLNIANAALSVEREPRLARLGVPNDHDSIVAAARHCSPVLRDARASNDRRVADERLRQKTRIDSPHFESIIVRAGNQKCARAINVKTADFVRMMRARFRRERRVVLKPNVHSKNTISLPPKNNR